MAVYSTTSTILSHFELFWLICFYRISAAFHVRVKEDPDLQSGRADRLLRPDRFCRH